MKKLTPTELAQTYSLRELHEAMSIKLSTKIGPTDDVSEILERSIEELDVPSMVTNALRRAGIRTIRELVGFRPHELLTIRGLGRGGLKLIVNNLATYNLALLPNRPPRS
jgi:DNA-directed RNA polymerase alpha subunit